MLASKCLSKDQWSPVREARGAFHSGDGVLVNGFVWSLGCGMYRSRIEIITKELGIE